MLKIGLTGGIGSGKTAVSNLFENLGIKIIDTDIISRHLLNKNPAAQKEVVTTFGKNIIDSTGAINRKKLAQIVFNNKDKKQQLENILHPAIRKEVNQQIQNYSSNTIEPAYILIVIPLLLETGFTDLIDRILVVITNEETRVQRVKQRDHRSMDEIYSIINNQVNDQQRIEYANDIIENNNDFNSLEEKVRQMHNKYKQLSKPPNKNPVTL